MFVHKPDPLGALLEPPWSPLGALLEVLFWRIPSRSFLDQLMKAMKAGKVSGKPMTKGDIQEYIAESTELHERCSTHWLRWLTRRTRRQANSQSPVCEESRRV